MKTSLPFWVRESSERVLSSKDHSALTCSELRLNFILFQDSGKTPLHHSS